MVKRKHYLRGDIMLYVLPEFVLFNLKFRFFITLTHMKGSDWV